MAALTDLTIAQLTAALAKKETSAVEVARHEFVALPASGQRSGVAIHAKNRGGDISSALLDD